MDGYSENFPTLFFRKAHVNKLSYFHMNYNNFNYF